MAISASVVKDLREKTGAGMMDCKKALVENDGDFEGAIDWLRKKGLSAAAKKADRVAAEGLTGALVVGTQAAAIELNSETDFVSKNEHFQKLVKEVLALAIDKNDLEELKATKSASGKTVDELVIENIATIGENLNLRRMQSVSVEDGVIAYYVHNSVSDNMGKISTLVALESTGDKAALEKLGREIAMHVAAAKPICLTRDEVDPALLEKERAIFSEQSRASGKAENIIDKMVEGRIRKYMEEIVLMDQTFVIDGKTKISDLVAQAAKDMGSDVKLKSFVRFELGEGVEKEKKNFADEVAQITNK